MHFLDIVRLVEHILHGGGTEDDIEHGSLPALVHRLHPDLHRLVLCPLHLLRCGEIDLRLLDLCLLRLDLLLQKTDTCHELRDLVAEHLDLRVDAFLLFLKFVDLIVNIVQLILVLLILLLQIVLFCRLYQTDPQTGTDIICRKKYCRTQPNDHQTSASFFHVYLPLLSKQITNLLPAESLPPRPGLLPSAARSPCPVRWTFCTS